MNMVEKLLENVESVVVGKNNVAKLILTAMLAEGHVLIEDVPGVGKTTLANAFARSMDCEFRRIQFTPDTMPGDVVGSSVFNFETHEFQYVAGAIMGNIVLADEINRTSPKTQASLLEAMGEGQVTIDGIKRELPYPFFVVATQNPVAQRGTYYLPESQLDRFMLKLSVGYPDVAESAEIVKRQLSGKVVKALENIAGLEDWKALIKEADKITIDDKLIDYAAEVVEATRHDDRIMIGASPRALISWIKAAKAYTYVDNREFVTPDDLKELAPYCLCHRLMLKQSLVDETKESRKVLGEILGKVKVPVFK